MPKRSRELSPKQLVFVAELLENGGNASAAYRKAFPDQSHERAAPQRAHNLKNDPRVVAKIAEAAAVAQQSIDRAMEAYGLTQDRCAHAMARLAYTELRQVVDVRTVTDEDGKRRQVIEVKDFARIDADAHQALIEVKKAADGSISVKLADKRQAIMDLARLKGWIADKPVDQRQLVMLKIER